MVIDQRLTCTLLRNGVRTKARLMMEKPYRLSIKKKMNMLLGGLKKVVMAANTTATTLTLSMIIRYSSDQDNL